MVAITETKRLVNYNHTGIIFQTMFGRALVLVISRFKLVECFHFSRDDLADANNGPIHEIQFCLGNHIFIYDLQNLIHISRMAK